MTPNTFTPVPFHLTIITTFILGYQRSVSTKILAGDKLQHGL